MAALPRDGERPQGCLQTPAPEVDTDGRGRHRQGLFVALKAQPAALEEKVNRETGGRAGRPGRAKFPGATPPLPQGQLPGRTHLTQQRLPQT